MPLQLPVASPWLQFGRGLFWRITDRAVNVHAAGIALFALLAAVPVLSAAIAVYALIADPTAVAEHMAGFRQVFPAPVLDFVRDSLSRAASSAPGELQTTLVISIVVALYAARHCADSLLEGLNLAYQRRETRRRLRRALASLAASMVALVAIVVVSTLVVAVPAVLALTFDAERWLLEIRALRWGILIAIMGLLLWWLYRHGPAPQAEPQRVPVWPGAIIGTVLWLLTSWGLSVWIGHVPRFNLIYGAFASITVLLLWSYLAALSVLIGGLVNAELARAAPDDPF